MRLPLGRAGFAVGSVAIAATVLYAISRLLIAGLAAGIPAGATVVERRRPALGGASPREDV